ncbi:MBL fold metallo-hydrolase [Parasphingorhabdus sp.]|uniref:MBL fold metallo-hydrolase n=1 Tax=Parasphingorhabdus sp. TaxID=2709688 RepID=UPI001B6AF7FC|nr:MBL fold metallo-hydrolase [Parasphingorhabdus sp.]MBQ0771365.1 MBL fold metallo-hydrolase [Sphingomonadales bacterium]|tara:strand:+ start:609 stop:1481 length:873 start_codon:yes stop_codon:yes gene_type:complete
MDFDPSLYPTGLCEQMEPLVGRVLAGNPSPYTYTGTQTYIVGNKSDRAVIDPGPANEAHIEAILAAVGDARISAIMCTHTHRDHSPAAAPLAARTGAPIIGCAPLVIETDAPRADESFDKNYKPDRILVDGETVPGDGWTIEAVATPGHTSNHLCLAVQESGALFTGDHVMAWSTSVIMPPDGNMADYMASLQKLYEREDKIYYPAHGKKVTNPRQLVRGMMGHRKQRERQILKLLETGPAAITEMVPQMYKGLDPRLTGAAGQSVRAHLIDLLDRGLVAQSGEVWSMDG